MSRLTGPDLEPVAPSGRSVGKRTMHPYTKRARTPLDPSDPRYIRSESIPYPGSNLSHFDGISWNQMPGGEGVPPGLVLTTPNRRLHPPLASPTFDISDSNRFRIPVRIKVLSQEYFGIKCRGGGGAPLTGPASRCYAHSRRAARMLRRCGQDASRYKQHDQRKAGRRTRASGF